MGVCHCLLQGKQCVNVTGGTASCEAVAHCARFPSPCIVRASVLQCEGRDGPIVTGTGDG